MADSSLALRGNPATGTGAAWYLLYDTDLGSIATDTLVDAHGNRYSRFASTRGGGVAATRWHLYRRKSRTEP